MNVINKSVLWISLFSLFLFYGPVLHAQVNLVPNPGFEYHTSCPDNYSELSLAYPWFQPTLATPDYYNVCGASLVGVPNNTLGSRTAHGGQAYAGAYMLVRGAGAYREYIETPLRSPLIAGHTYLVSFYVSLASSGSDCAVDNPGAYFSNNSITSDEITNLVATPQVRNPPGNFLNSSDWTLIQGIYAAAGGEKYLTIGNFYDNAHTPTEPANGTRAYYYIDDVSVIDIKICNNGCIAITSPNDIVVSTCSNSLAVDYSIGVTDSCCSIFNLHTVPPSGHYFPLGTTTVTNTVTDNCGNSNSCSFTVTVIQNTNPPVIFSCPTNIDICTIVSNGCGIMPDATNEVQAMTAGGGPASVTQSIAPGTEVCSDTNVTFTATDACGDAIQTNVPCHLIKCTNCLQVLCPSNIVETTCSNSLAVDYQVEVSESCCTNNCFTLKSFPPSGYDFPPGTTTVTNTANDAFGNTNTCTFTVTVIQDASPPIILSCPTNLVICTSNGCATMPDETGKVQAVAADGGSVTITQSIEAGTNVCSDTNVTFTVTDGCGNVTQTNVPCILIACSPAVFTESFNSSNSTVLTLTWPTNGLPVDYWQLQFSTDFLHWTDVTNESPVVLNFQSNYTFVRSNFLLRLPPWGFFQLMHTNGP